MGKKVHNCEWSLWKTAGFLFLHVKIRSIATISVVVTNPIFVGFISKAVFRYLYDLDIALILS